MSVDISKISDNLFLASHMRQDDVDVLREMDIKLIISMIGQSRPPQNFTQEPFRLLWLKSYDTFLTPVPMRKLKQGVEAALPVLQRKENVLVFCHQGKRRSATMAASILIALGHSADEAMNTLIEKREVVSPMLWYVKARIRKFERYWTKKDEQ